MPFAEMQPVKASVVITTKNRKDELRNALASCRMQSVPHEVIVIDDGSSDGTSQLVTSEFPEVRLVRHEVSAGLIERRNEAAHLASGDIVFSIDDDAEFSTPSVIEQTLLDFDDPRVGVVAVPLVEPKYGDPCFQRAPDPDALWVISSFKGTAYAVRRDVFCKVGAFRADLVHQGEESDLAIRLLDEGLVVRAGRSDPIIHHESPKRDLRRTHFYGRRNDVLFAFRNVPTAFLAPHALATTWNGLRLTLVSSPPGAMLRGILRGWVDGVLLWGTRRPVRGSTYRVFRRLRAREATRIEDL